MIITAHMIAGGVAGEVVQSSFLAFALGIVLHFILDAVPHFDNLLDEGERWNYKQVLFLIFDVILLFVLSFYVLKLPFSLKFFNTPFFYGALGGIFPDILDNVPFWQGIFQRSKWGRKIHYFHDKIQLKNVNPFFGLLTQAIVIYASMAIYFLVK